MSNAGPKNLRRRHIAEHTVIDGRFQVTGMLGEGGFATVYRAWDLQQNKEIALKVSIAADMAMGDFDYGEFEMRFFREARAGQSIEHDNLATIYGSGYAEGALYIAMELFEGHTLEHELAVNGPLYIERAVRLFLPALEALSYAHFAGVVHRDLKPPNLFISRPDTAEETLVILDFGVARLIDGDSFGKLTTPGKVLGTPNYTAPEALKEAVSSPACDVYSMALIFIGALTARKVIHGDSIYATMAMHVSGEYQVPVWLFDKNPLGAVLNRALAVEPEHRFPDGQSLLDAMRSLDFRRIHQGDNATTQPIAALRDSGRIPPLSFNSPNSLSGLHFPPTAAAAQTTRMPEPSGSNPAVQPPTSRSNPQVQAQSGQIPNARRSNPNMGYDPNVSGPPPGYGWDSGQNPNIAAMSAAISMQQLQAQQAAAEPQKAGIVGILVMIVAIIAALGILGAVVWFGFLGGAM